MEPPYDLLVLVLGYGGLRIGEASALRRSDVAPLRSRLRVERSMSEVGGVIHVGSTKTYARRYARLPRFVSERLAEHLARHVDPGPDSLVFEGPSRGPIRHGNFRARIWTPAAIRAGLPDVKPHDLRHSCASFLIRRGASVRAVAEQLGHSTPMVTLNTYAHVFEGDLDRLYDGVDVQTAKRNVDQLWTSARTTTGREGE